MSRKQGWLLISAIWVIASMLAFHYGHNVPAVLFSVLAGGAALLAVWETE